MLISMRQESSRLCMFFLLSLPFGIFSLIPLCVCLTLALVTLCFCPFRITSQRKIWIWHIRIWALCPRNGTVGFAAIHHIYGYPLSFAPFQMLSKIYVWRHTHTHTQTKRKWKIQSTFVALFCMIYRQKLELRFEMKKKGTWRQRQRLRE